jgi:hypothetical protein
VPFKAAKHYNRAGTQAAAWNEKQAATWNETQAAAWNETQAATWNETQAAAWRVCVLCRTLKL